MQLFTIISKIIESLGIVVGITIIGFILAYFTKEIIRNLKRNSFKRYDSQKDIQRKIKREQLKVEKLLKRKKEKFDGNNSK